MNYSKYAGCRVEFVLWKPKHKECRESGLLVRARESGLLVRADGDGFLYKREEDGFMCYIHSPVQDFRAFMKPKDMSLARLYELANKIIEECPYDYELGQVSFNVDGKIEFECAEYCETDCGTECMDDSPLIIDPDKEVEVTGLFEEEGE